jgi:hypothetical protein
MMIRDRDRKIIVNKDRCEARKHAVTAKPPGSRRVTMAQMAATRSQGLVEQELPIRPPAAQPTYSDRVGKVRARDAAPVAQAPCDMHCWVCSDNNPCMFQWGHNGPHRCNRGHTW